MSLPALSALSLLCLFLCATAQDDCQVPVGGACSADDDCVDEGPTRFFVKCVDGKCAEQVPFGYVGDCVDGGCPNGIECETNNINGPKYNNRCFQRRKPGEQCLTSGRYQRGDGWACQRRSEHGGPLGCVPGPDAVALPGPGPGGCCGGFSGFGNCKSSADAGAPCGDGSKISCPGECVNGFCTA